MVLDSQACLSSGPAKSPGGVFFFADTLSDETLGRSAHTAPRLHMAGLTRPQVVQTRFSSW